MIPIEYPYQIQIETSQVCNGKCWFCPRDRTKAASMSDGFFAFLIAQIAGWSKPPQYILPFLTNEPFADPRIFDFCQLINQQIPTAKLTFYTNASLLDAEKLDKLCQLKNVDGVRCSLNSYDPKDYERVMGLDFHRTIQNIKRLIRCGRFDVQVIRVGDLNERQRFKNFCAREFPEVLAVSSPVINWKGDIKSDYDGKEFMGMVCSRTNHMCIMADGRVALCCMDQNGDYALGDAKTTPLLDIFNSDRRREYHTKVKRDLVPCKICSNH